MNALGLLLAAPAARAPSSGAGVSWPTIAGSAVVAATVGALINLWLARRKSHDEERARVRSICAEAFEAVAAYKEMPFAIRRRETSRAEDERVRLSAEMRAIQAKISYYVAWMKGESSRLGTAYDRLVTEVRRLVGTACRDAWLQAGVSSDAEMNIPPGTIDLTAITAFEEEYVDAVRQHLDELLRIRVRG